MVNLNPTQIVVIHCYGGMQNYTGIPPILGVVVFKEKEEEIPNHEG